jgi:endosialidase-like protein
MSRNPSGIYSLPGGTYPQTPNTTVESIDWNQAFADLEQDANLARPIVAGGTGSGTASGARTNLGAEAAKQTTASFNFDSFAFENGSFYYGASSTSAPSANAGIGTALVSDANNIVLEAYDLVTSKVYKRFKVGGSWLFSGAWVAASAEDKVSKTGDTMTGNLTISRDGPDLVLNRTGTNSARILGTKSGNVRWIMQVGVDAEGGGNTGSDFAIERWNDAGFIAEALRIKRDTGAVGIGLSNPSAPLQVKANASSLALSVRGRTGDSAATIALMSESDVQLASMFLPAGGSGDLAFQTAGSGNAEKLRIKSGGDVVVGATDIVGAAAYPAGYRALNLTGASDRAVLELASSAADASSALIGQVSFFANSNTVVADRAIASIYSLKDGATAGNRGGSLNFVTKKNGAGLALAMTINEKQNVGIGGSPSTGTDRLLVTGGNVLVGDGTTTPSIRQWGLGSGSGAGAQFVIDLGGSPAVGYFGNTSATLGGAFDSTMTLGGYFGLKFATTHTTRMNIDTNGRVGVGANISSIAQLQVEGLGYAGTNYADGNNTGGTLFLKDTGGGGGNGGQLLFGNSNGVFAGIKGHLSNGTGPAGHLILQTRTTSGNVLERMRITDNGRVGIGGGEAFTAPAAPLSLGFPANDANLRTYANNDQAIFGMYCAQNFPAANNFARVLDIGVGGGNIGGYMRFLVQGASGASVGCLFIGPNGFTYPASDNAFQCGQAANRWTSVWAVNGTIQTSDENAKEMIEDSDLGLAFINAVRPIMYRERTDAPKDGDGQAWRYGVSAQQVQHALGDKPFAGLVQDPETGLYGTSYTSFVAPLITAVQELSARIEALEGASPR